MLNVVLIGLPGVGKGTQAVILAEKYEMMSGDGTPQEVSTRLRSVVV